VSAGRLRCAPRSALKSEAFKTLIEREERGKRFTYSDV
jgi:hypothetical protein